MEPHDEIAEHDTGLFSEAYLHSFLPTRVAAARRGLRPLGLAVIEVDADDVDPVTVAGAITYTLRDSDTPCRLDDGRYALILEDTPLGGSHKAIVRVRELLDERVPGSRHWAGVACYPAHAFQEDELLDQAERALTLAHENDGGGLEIAKTPDE